ncbi:MAG: ribosome-associated translation inhibitor RaiA, partial [Eubacteriales bacterium]|nr:ribosome-associated translation inhibitor RaiA [Eubacteriales bacterium]
DVIDKKFAKLSKYFSDDITARVVLSKQKDKDKIEATINAKGAVFRAEEVCDDIYDGIEAVVDRLAAQMKKFKGKLQKRYNDNKALKFEMMPDTEEETEEETDNIVRKKNFTLRPMDVEEAILEMEMLEHNFFVFLDTATDSVSVVYKRNDGGYGVIETER